MPDAVQHLWENRSGRRDARLPGEYSSLAISKAIEIIADEGQASITSSSNGSVSKSGRFYVNAGAADDVRIRGFTLKAGSGGVVGPIAGVSFVSAGSLYVENCILVDSTGNYGILFIPTGASELYVSNSVLSDNGAASDGGGILIKPTGSGTARVVVENALVEDNRTGIQIDGRSTTSANTVTIRNSTIAGSTGFGVYAVDGGSGSTNVMIEGSTVTNNGGNAERADAANAIIRMRNSTVSGISAACSWIPAAS